MLHATKPILSIALAAPSKDQQHIQRVYSCGFLMLECSFSWTYSIISLLLYVAIVKNFFVFFVINYTFAG